MSKQLALYIDHNHQRQSRVCQALKSLGFDLHKTSAALDAQKFVRKNRYHLVLMDFDSLGNKTYQFCSFIRTGSYSTIIIVIMPSVKIKIEERLFDSGVNDVIIGKQAANNVLTKRIYTRLNTSKAPLLETNTIRIGNTIINFDRQEVWCNGTTRQLSGISSDLLKYFLDNSNRVISRKELLNSPIWADSICSPADEGGKTFDVNIGKLRRIIEPDPFHPKIIISVRGVGWKLSSYAFE